MKKRFHRCRAARFEALESREFLAVTAGGVAAAGESAVYAAGLSETDALVPRPTEAVSLAAPVISSVAAGGGTSHRITWNRVENALTYQLSYSADGENWKSLVTSETSAAVADLVCGNRMRYRVRAQASGGAVSGWSGVKTLYVCPADIDGDGFLGPGDNALLSAAWFTAKGDAAWNPACDVDGDGFVGPGDNAILSAVWFQSREEVAITSLGLAYIDECVLIRNTENADVPLRKGDVVTIADRKGDTPYYTETLNASWDSFFIESPEEPGTYRYYVTVTRPGALYGWEGSLTVTVERKEVQPEDIAVSLAWDAAGHGLALSWTAKKDFQKDAVVDLCFASGAKYSGIVDSAAASAVIPAGTKAGASGTILVDGAELYTEVPSSRFDTIVACLNGNVVASITDVSLSISGSVVQSVVNQPTYDAIKYACRAVGKSSIRLTSGWRTPYQQADAMFYNLARSDVQAAITYQYSLYGRAGDQVISVFEQQAILYDYNQTVIKAHSAEIIGMMTDKINELDAQGIRVSNHCVSEEKYRAHNIMDVSRSGFDSANIPVFTAAAKKMGCVKVLDEPANGCLHLEF